MEVTRTYNASIWEVETGEPEIQYMVNVDSLGYMRYCLSEPKKITQLLLLKEYLLVLQIDKKQ